MAGAKAMVVSVAGEAEAVEAAVVEMAEEAMVVVE